MFSEYAEEFLAVRKNGQRDSGDAAGKPQKGRTKTGRGEKEGMKTVWMYAGQGSQRVGMGKDLYGKFPVFASVIDKADAMVSFDLKKMMFEGPAEELSRTAFTQPCLAAFAAGVTEVLRQQGCRPDFTSGLSLGEYSALYAAEVLDLSGLMDLTAFRGNAMDHAGSGLRFNIGISGQQFRCPVQIHRCVKFLQPVQRHRSFSGRLHAIGRRLLRPSQRGYETVVHLQRRSGLCQERSFPPSLFCQCIRRIIRLRVSYK